MSYKLLKGVLLVAVLLLNACGRLEKSTPATTANENAANDLIRITSSQFEQGAMKLGQLQESVFKKKIQVTGTIDVPPQNKAVVSIPVGGYITRTTLIIGDQVKKGQVLMTLENPEFIKLQQNYLEITQQLRFLRAEYERHQKLYEENITSEKNFIKSETEYKTALARYTGLKKQLSMLHISAEAVEAGKISSETHIYAPISGSISRMNVTKGAYISPATEILEIINTDHIHLELAVFEKDIIQIKEGQHINFRIPEASETYYNGSVYRLGRSIDENRRILVHGHIEEGGEYNFIKGMYVDAFIVTDTLRHPSLPESAVVESGGRNYVLKLEDKEGDAYLFKPLEVKVLESDDGLIAIGPDTNIRKEDQFLTSGAFSLLGSY